jgi:site-specific DNA-methyltransferase (adenine-specific)
VSEPYYSDGFVSLYHGDCREILPTLRGEWLTLTDPPYGIAHPTDYKARRRGDLAACNDYAPIYGDNEPFDPSHLLAIRGQHILWGANYYADKLPTTSGWLVWDKERPDGLDQATCELAWTDCIKGVRRFRHMWNGMLRDSERGNGALVHPTQKPVELLQWCLTHRWVNASLPVLDPYVGGGSTLIAAKNLNRRVVGIEIEERYCEIAAQRMSQEVLDFGGAA